MQLFLLAKTVKLIVVSSNATDESFIYGGIVLALLPDIHNTPFPQGMCNYDLVQVFSPVIRQSVEFGGSNWYHFFCERAYLCTQCTVIMYIDRRQILPIISYATPNGGSHLCVYRRGECSPTEGGGDIALSRILHQFLPPSPPPQLY